MADGRKYQTLSMSGVRGSGRNGLPGTLGNNWSDIGSINWAKLESKSPASTGGGKSEVDVKSQQNTSVQESSPKEVDLFSRPSDEFVSSDEKFCNDFIAPLKIFSSRALRTNEIGNLTLDPGLAEDEIPTLSFDVEISEKEKILSLFVRSIVIVGFVEKEYLPNEPYCSILKFWEQCVVDEMHDGLHVVLFSDDLKKLSKLFTTLATDLLIAGIEPNPGPVDNKAKDKTIVKHKNGQKISANGKILRKPAKALAEKPWPVQRRVTIGVGVPRKRRGRIVRRRGRPSRRPVRRTKKTARKGMGRRMPRSKVSSMTWVNRMQTVKSMLSSYLHVLLDPFNNICKIPQGSTPSVAARMDGYLLSQNTTGASASFCFGLRRGIEAGTPTPAPFDKNVACLVPNTFCLGDTFTTSSVYEYNIGSYHNNVTNLSNIVPGGDNTTNPALTYINWAATTEMIPAAYAGCRLVSFGFRFRTMAPALTSGGTLIIAFFSPDDLPNDRNFDEYPMTQDEMLRQPYVALFNLNNIQEVYECRWYPQDQVVDYQYTPIENEVLDEGDTIIEIPFGYNRGTFIGLFTPINGEGEIPSVKYFLEYVGVYEFIPRQSSGISGTNMSATFPDEQELNHALNETNYHPMIYSTKKDVSSSLYTGRSHGKKYSFGVNKMLNPEAISKSDFKSFPIPGEDFVCGFKDVTVSNAFGESAVLPKGDYTKDNFLYAGRVAKSKMSSMLNGALDTVERFVPLYDRALSLMQYL